MIIRHLGKSRFKEFIIGYKDKGVKIFSVENNNLRETICKAKKVGAREIMKKDSVYKNGSLYVIGDRLIGSELVIESDIVTGRNGIVTTTEYVNKLKEVIKAGNKKIEDEGLGYKYNKELGVYEVINDNIYGSILVNTTHGDRIQTEYKDNFSEIMEISILANIKVMEKRVFKEVLGKSVILNRVDIGSYIIYNIIDENNELKQVSIDEINTNIDKYLNCGRLENNSIVIEGIDGTYQYVIDDTNIVKNNKTKKARMVGIEHEEDVSLDGNLIHLRTSYKDVTVDDSVRNIDKMALKITNNNERLIIGNRVEHIDNEALYECSKGDYGTELGYKNFKYIEIYNRDNNDIVKITKGLIISLLNNSHTRMKKITINYVNRMKLNDAFRLMVLTSDLHFNINLDVENGGNLNIDTIEKIIGMRDYKKLFSTEDIYTIDDRSKYSDEYIRGLKDNNKIVVLKQINNVTYNKFKEFRDIIETVDKAIRVHRSVLIKSRNYNEVKDLVEDMRDSLYSEIDRLEKMTGCIYNNDGDE